MKPQLADAKVSPPTGFGEADESLFEYLHAEMVNYVLSTPSSNRVRMCKMENKYLDVSRLLVLSTLNVISIDLIQYSFVVKQKEGEEDLSKLEWMGFGVGYRVIERLTREWPRFKEELDTIKFICTDFWSSLYQKPIDNLKTNHHGVYVLQDYEFRLLSKLGSGESKQYLYETPRLLIFTCGLLRGSLANLGIVSEVTAEIVALPACKFHVKVQRV